MENIVESTRITSDFWNTLAPLYTEKEMEIDNDFSFLGSVNCYVDPFEGKSNPLDDTSEGNSERITDKVTTVAVNSLRGGCKEDSVLDRGRGSNQLEKGIKKKEPEKPKGSTRWTPREEGDLIRSVKELSAKVIRIQGEKRIDLKDLIKKLGGSTAKSDSSIMYKFYDLNTRSHFGERIRLTNTTFAKSIGQSYSFAKKVRSDGSK